MNAAPTAPRPSGSTAPNFPPPAGAPLPPPPPRATTPAPGQTIARPRRPWRERLPELVAGAGSALVVAAIVGFASSSWDLLGPYPQAMALAIGATLLSVGSLWSYRSDRSGLQHVGTALWVAGTAAAMGAIWLAGSTSAPDAARAAIGLAGLAGVVHAGAQWNRRRDSITLQFATLAAAVYAAGPIGSAIADRYRADLVEDLFLPIGGLFDLTLRSDAFLITGIGHLAIGVAWLVLAHHLADRASVTARVSGSLLVAYAALSFNVLTLPVGAALALLIVIAYLIAGIALEDALLLFIGSTGALVTGTRVIWSLFTGEVAVTITVFTAGVLMLGWAYRAASQRRAD